LFGWLVAGGWCSFIVKEKYCWLASGLWLELVRFERKVLMVGWLTSQPNTDQPAEQATYLYKCPDNTCQ